MKAFVTVLMILIGSTYHLTAQDTITIVEARALPSGTAVVVEATISTPDYGFNHGQFFIQDSTAGVNIFFQNIGGEVGAMTEYGFGDQVLVKGQTGVFEEQKQIQPTEIVIVESGEEGVAPADITVSDISIESSFLGSIVRISGVTLTDESEWPVNAISSGSGTNVTAQVGETTFIIRIDRGQSFFDESPVPQQPFTLTGVMGRFREDAQIFPFFESDISSETTNSIKERPLAESVKIFPNPVSETINVDLIVPTKAIQKVVLFDLTGRAVSELSPKNVVGTSFNATIPASIPNGQYNLQIITEEGFVAKKIVVSRNN